MERKSQLLLSSAIAAVTSVFFGSVVVGYGQETPPKTSAPDRPNASGTVDLQQRGLNEKATVNLARKWAQQLTSGRSTGLKAAAAVLQESAKPAPQQRTLAITSNAKYINPEEVRSVNGVLTVTLEANYADNVIGKDPVRLRNFNGKLVGPTLRVKQGEKIRLTLKNSLPGERWQPNMMNTLNSFNTMNLHYHGLHVSPNGISDNVLIQVGPGESQYYELDIPADHPTGTFWYHPHRHGSTAATVASGMSGALIIEPKDDKVLCLDNLKEIKEAQELILVLNQIPYVKDNDFPGPPPKKFNFKVGQIEETEKDYIFGPGDWATLGRYTTVNGVQLPVFPMRPGEVQRWRIVDSGQREAIHLQLVRADGSPAPMVFHEIAVDGLARGKMVETGSVELWPGYRSDVLLKAPSEPGEYLLIDAASNETITGIPKPLTYVARVSVQGKPKPMNLPTSEEMKGMDLGTIKDTELTGNQQVRYGILLVGGGVVFTIDGQSFSMETAKTVKLGDVEEWTINSINDVGGVTHPFHIHVNPFLVTSIMEAALDAQGNVILKNGYPILTEQLKSGPEWRDTVKIPGGGYVKMRTRYEDFIGTFVQHCHILDHEDQGMMQLIDIVDKSAASTAAVSSPRPALGSYAPSFTLPDGRGNLVSLKDVGGQPTVVFFFKGHGCLHCVQQVTAFTDHYEEFVKKGYRVIGITSDSAETLKKALEDYPCPFPLLADPKGVAFQAYGCAQSDGLQHGTFTLDENRRITWSTTGASPYLAVRDLLKDAPPAPTLGWTPTVAPIGEGRAALSSPAATPVRVSELTSTQ